MGKGDFTLGEPLSAGWAKVKENIGLAIGITIVYYIIVMLCTYIIGIGWIVGFFIMGPVLYGFAGVFLDMVNSKKPEFGRLFSGFGQFGRSFVGYFTMLFFGFLWMCLFVIPGIIAFLRYSLTFFVLNDNPELSGNQARKKSCELTKGHKGKIFIYNILFIIPIIGPPLSYGALGDLYNRVK